MMKVLPIIALARREIVRFLRERSRMIGVIVSPILFWLVIGSGLNHSFQHAGEVPAMNYLEYFFPGSVVLVVLFASIFSSISVIEDRKEGFLQSVLVAPIPRVSIVAGKVLGICFLATIQGTVFLVMAPLVVSEITIGSILLAGLVLSLVALGLSAMGFAMAWMMESTQGFHAIMNLLLVPMWLVSGSLFPSSGASEWVAFLMKWNPLTYGVAAVRTSLYGLRPQYSSDLPGFGESLIVLAAFGALMVILGMWSVGRRERGTRVPAEGMQ